MNKWSISKRAIFLGLAPAVFMFFTLTAYFINDKFDVLQEQLNNKGELLVQQLAPATEYAVFIKNPTLLEDIVSPILKESDVAFVEIYDQTSELLLSRKNLSLVEHLNNNEIRQFNSDIILQDVPLESTDFDLGIQSLNGADGTKIIGSITIGLTTQQLQQEQKQALLGGIFIALLSLLFATVLALFISRTITTPVKSLSETVKLFKSGLLSARVVEQSGGELGSLESNLNSMAVSLERAKRKELEHSMALEQARAEAQATSQAKSQFLISMSNELRRPMNGSLGNLQLLEASKLSKKQKEHVEQTIHSTNQLLVLLDNIYDYSHLQNHSLTLQPEHFDLTRLINRCCAPVIEQCKIKEVDVHVYLEEKRTNIELHTDQIVLQKIISHILNNAVANTEHGYIDIIAKWRPTEDQHKLHLSLEISDTGASYSAEQISNLFQLSKDFPPQVNTQQSFNLGLIIAKQLTELLGGTINISSRQTEGTLYQLEFIFPYRLRDAKKSSRPVKSSKPPSSINGRILVIDPNPIDLQVAKDMLNLFGATVDTAITAQIGLERMRQFSYQLIIIDTALEDESIQTIIDKFKAYARAKNLELPILLTTNFSDNEKLKDLLEEHTDDILNKPYSMQMFKTRVQAQLNTKTQNETTPS